MQGTATSPPLPNVLRFQLEPDRIALRAMINGPEDSFELEPADLDMMLAPQTLPAHARLMLDDWSGDRRLSVRADEAEESWRIVQPIVDEWHRGAVPLLEYPAGSAGQPPSTGP